MPTFRPPSPRRERILMMGASGSGKTSAWLTIAKKAEQLKGPGRFFVMDTDLSLPAMLGGERFGLLAERTQWMRFQSSPNPNLAGLWVPDEDRGLVEDPRLIAFEPYEWDEYMAASIHIKQHMLNDDWAISDLHNPTWNAVQDFYIDTIFKKDSSHFYLEAREKQGDKRGNPLDGDKDWSNINRLYRDFNNVFTRARGHVFLCTAVKAVQTDGGRVDLKEIRVTYGPHGVKPEGQKDNAFIMHTVILATEFTPGVYKWTTVKDREREKMVGEDANDFAMQYLVQRAGWKMA